MWILTTPVIPIAVPVIRVLPSTQVRSVRSATQQTPGKYRNKSMGGFRTRQYDLQNPIYDHDIVKVFDRTPLGFKCLHNTVFDDGAIDNWIRVMFANDTITFLLFIKWYSPRFVDVFLRDFS